MSVLASLFKSSSPLTPHPPPTPAPVPQLEKLQAAVLDAGVEGAEFLPVVADLSREAEVAALPRIIDKRWPGAGVDVLVNNAGGRGWRERSAGRGGGGGCVHESCQALMGGLRGLFLRPSLRGLPVC
jgi:NAD(P)-dependent dehydrogenase (short-subunit alcohol dehydrogenase family)